ncbi:MAG TPA: low-specificity L-threonine aldolase [Arenimonas sp.]|jgi:threonine aldolase|nr:low-specificity L-threonine aldolase [Arenimonas sp.]
MKLIDLRSDTVTLPSAAMRACALEVPLGDDVFGEDATVNALQKRCAEELGFEAGLFVSSGTQSNLLALMAHCERGDEYIVGSEAHTYKFEGGGAAVLGSIQPQPIPQQADGTLDLAMVAAAIKPIGDPHFARTRCFTLENTWWGRVLPQSYIAEAATLAKQHQLAFHLDGARLFNASVAQGIHAREIAKHFDSVSVCFSKGLGAPVGSILLGSEELISKARRWRKVLGGGWRQAGLLAAMANYALDNHVERLADDHRRAAELANALNDISAIEVNGAFTSMVFITVPKDRLAALAAHMQSRNIKLSTGNSRIRLVMHLDIDDEDLRRIIEAFRSF